MYRLGTQIFIFLATWSSHAVMAAPMVAFGLEFDQPLTLPECPYTTGPVSGEKFYSFTPPKTCQQPNQKATDHAVPVARIVFSQAEQPSIVKNFQAVAIQDATGLIGLRFLTAGIPTQDLVLQQLTEKFGKPTSISTNKVKLRSGAEFDAIFAEWRLPDRVVAFDGTDGNFDFGQVTIDRPAAAEMRQSWRAQKSKEKRNL